MITFWLAHSPYTPWQRTPSAISVSSTKTQIIRSILSRRSLHIRGSAGRRAFTRAPEVERTRLRFDPIRASVGSAAALKVFMPRWGGDGCNVHCVPFGAGGCGEGSGALGGERAAETPALAHRSLLSPPGRRVSASRCGPGPGPGPERGLRRRRRTDGRDALRLRTAGRRVRTCGHSPSFPAVEDRPLCSCCRRRCGSHHRRFTLLLSLRLHLQGCK